MKTAGYVVSAILTAVAVIGIIRYFIRKNDGRKHLLPPMPLVLFCCGLSIVLGIASIFMLRFVSEKFIFVTAAFAVFLIPACTDLLNSDCVYDENGCVYTTFFGSKREYSYAQFVYSSRGYFKGRGAGNSLSTHMRIITDDGKTMHVDTMLSGYFDFLHFAHLKNKSFAYLENDPDDDKKHFPDPYKGNVRHGWFFIIVYLTLALIFSGISIYAAVQFSDIANIENDLTEVRCTVASVNGKYLVTDNGKKYGCPVKAEKYVEANTKNEYVLLVAGDDVYGIIADDGNVLLSKESALASYKSNLTAALISGIPVALGGFACLILSLMGGRHPEKHPFLYSIMFYRDM